MTRPLSARERRVMERAITWHYCVAAPGYANWATVQTLVAKGYMMSSKTLHSTLMEFAVTPAGLEALGR